LNYTFPLTQLPFYILLPNPWAPEVFPNALIDISEINKQFYYKLDSLVTVLLGDVDEEVDNTSGVTVFVVVPGDELDEVLVQQDTSLGVEDGGVGVAQEVGGDDVVLSVVEDALELALGLLLDDGLDVVVRGALVKSDSQVDNGHVSGWDTEGETSELAIEVWDDLADCLGGTGGRWDDVARSSSATSPVLVGWTVNGLLGGGDGVAGGHQALDDAKVVVDNLGQWGQAVGGARSVRDDLEVGGVLLLVDTNNEHWGVLGWSRDDDLLGATLQVGLSLGLLSENTGGLDNVVGTSLAPWNRGRVLLVEDLDSLAVNDKTLVVVGHVTLVSAVGRVVLEHVGGVVNGDEWVVDSNNLHSGVGESISQHQSTNSAESVNTNLNHFEISVCVCLLN
jgi:hypothetical protein